ncbi:MAG TPA: dNTP triphosphohydrolase [Terracidiphilus sp.]|nr:dNTP triphosphohydrolase [Terracidiphilus sp.]
MLPAGIAVDSSGDLARRDHDEPPHPYRTPFDRDAARVLHARAFRRLAGKTQVFTRLPGDAISDHFRSRLTHTLEVTQISRTLAHTLGLNSELVEALALTHDIGHPPFGHAGEKALDHALKAHGLRFDHNLHALRIVTWFEERYAGFRGLNLTLGVREGIIKHSRDYAAAAYPELAGYFLDLRPPLEAQIIDLADEIAYLTADLDDGLESGILSLGQVRECVPLFRGFHDEVASLYPAAPPTLSANETLKRMLNALVTDLMQEIHRGVASLGIATLNDVRHAPARLAGLSPRMDEARAESKQFLFENLYSSQDMEDAHRKAHEIVLGLFNLLLEKPAMLPADHQGHIASQGLARTVADYIAGMTDSYISNEWQRCQHR